MPAPVRMRTPAQNARMHALAAKLGTLGRAHRELVPADVEAAEGGDLGRQWLRHVCTQISGQPSSAQLTVSQAIAVCESLEAATAQLQQAALGAPEPEARIAPPRAEGTVTPEQWKYIDQLCGAIARLGGRYARMAGTRRHMMRWAQHYLGVAWPQSQADADVAVEAFKSILARELPAPAVLGAQLAECQQRRDELVPFGQRLVADAPRAHKWGPYQWAKLHEVWSQLPEPRTASEAGRST